jgi:hypothetical protein
MLRERTLRHLLLSVAKSLEEVPENIAFRNLLIDSCETLQIVREDRGPYVVTVSNEKGQITTKIETSRFRFHERGDVPAQVGMRRDLPDARTHNWEQALIFWQDILGVSLERTRGLAPMRQIERKTNRLEITFIVIVSIALLTVQFLTALTWPVVILLAWLIPLTKPKYVHLWTSLLIIASSVLFSGVENALFPLPILIVAFHLESLSHSKFAVFWPFFGILVITLLYPRQLPIALLILALETMVSVVQINYPRLRVQLVCVSITLFYLLLFKPVFIAENLNGWITAPIVLILIFVVFPRSSESNLIRVTAPIALMFATIYFGYDTNVSFAWLLVWLLGIKEIHLTKKSKRQDSNLPGVSVTISKRSSAS